MEEETLFSTNLLIFAIISATFKNVLGWSTWSHFVLYTRPLLNSSIKGALSMDDKKSQAFP